MADKVAIVTDSVACLPKELVEEYGIEVVPIEVCFGDEVYRDGVDINPDEFYVRLRRVEKLPTTAAALPGPFLETFRKASRRATSILCITLSSKLSGMFNSARLAIEMAKESLPNVVVKLLDSETAAAAEGLVVLAAARVAALGKSITEVLEAAESVMQRVRLIVMVDTLHYLVKGGRVPKIAAVATSLLKIKPLLTIKMGEAVPLTNPRTIPRALKRMLQIMKQKIVKGQPLHVAVMHADAQDKAIELKNQISSEFKCAELFITEFTPVMGAHTGPGVIGIAFHSGD